jgi:hypothetical protein
MTETVTLRPLTAEDRVLSRASPRGSYGGKNGPETGLSHIILLLFSQFLSSNAA